MSPKPKQSKAPATSGDVAGRRTARDLEAERVDRRACALDFLARWDAAAEAVLGDLGVWIDEARREDAPPMPWPWKLPASGWPQALARLTERKLLQVYVQMAAGHWGHMLPRMHASDPDFQWLMRVAVRAARAGEAALVAHYGGERLSLAREFNKMNAEGLAEVARDSALQAGAPVAAAFKAAGLSPRAAFRAVRRAQEGRRAAAPEPTAPAMGTLRR